MWKFQDECDFRYPYFAIYRIYMNAIISWVNPRQRQWKLYCELELIPEPIAEPTWFDQIWQKLAKALFDQPEPTIWQIPDSDGYVWWYVYDSASGRSYWFASEEEVRVWLDYYRKF
jgi:hypothetical protein